MNRKPNINPQLKEHLNQTGWFRSILISFAQLNSPPKAAADGKHTSAWAVSLCVLMFLGTAFSTPSFSTRARTVHVGLYQNKPKVFTDEGGVACGYFCRIAR